IRAYELAAGTKYALLTELYYDRFNNSQYVKNKDLIAEVTAGEAKTEEFDVLNSKDNDFVLPYTNYENWTDLFGHFTGDWKNAYKTHDDKEDTRDRVVLQPAVNNMALSDHPASVDRIFENVSTNIARYVQTDEGVRITTAAEYARDKKNNERLYYGYDTTNDEVDYKNRYNAEDWRNKFETSVENDRTITISSDSDIPADFAVYKYNYIELNCWEGISADQRHYDIADERTAPDVVHAADGQYRDSATSYVNAVHDTEYYIVNRKDNKIDYFTDYDNVKKIDAELIEAVYAVAENTEADNSEHDYWVADVIVIEVNGWNGDVDNISLVFDNYQQTSQRVKFLDTLTTKYEGVNAHVIPGGREWGTRWQDIEYGFYMLLDAEKDGDELVADDIDMIKKDFAKYGIKAGVVTRVDKVSSRGGYIDVELKNSPAHETGRAYLPDDRNAVYAIDGSEAVDGLRVSEKDNGDLRVGDEVIWVEKADDSKVVYFMVVVSDKADEHKHDWDSPSWLEKLHDAIMAEQSGEGNAEVAGAPVVTFYGKTVPANTTSVAPFIVSWTDADEADEEINIAVTNASGVGISGGASKIEDVQPSKDADKSYTLTVYGDNGNFYTYYLEQSAASDDATLSPDVADYITVAADNTVTLDVKTMSINEFIEVVTANDPNATVTYTFVNGQGTIDPKNYSQSMENVLAFTITVVAEDGTKAVYEYADASITKWDLRIPSNASAITVYNAQTNEQLKGTYDGPPADGAVYAIPDGTSIYLETNRVGEFYAAWGSNSVDTGNDTMKVNVTVKDGKTTTDPIKVTNYGEIAFKNAPKSEVNIALELGNASNITADLNDNAGAKQTGDVIYYENVKVGDTVTFTVVVTNSGTISGHEHAWADVVLSSGTSVTDGTQYTIKYTPKVGITDNIYLAPTATVSP
ncbi:MAG: hypothetical protein K2O93_06960, partial [Oscillospiraceae bacterium]|nr:hypothetical protein [Oscillospiraceae bacterium]